MDSMVGTIPKPVRLDKGGTLKVGDTRVSLDSVIYAFNRGEDAAQIQYAFDTLSLAEIHGAISYYLHNKNEVDAYLKRQAVRFEKMRKDTNSTGAAAQLREKILARKNGLDPDWNR